MPDKDASASTGGVWSWPKSFRGRTGFLIGIAVGVAVMLLAENVLVRGESEVVMEAGDLVIMADLDQSLNQQRRQLVKEWNARHGEDHYVTMIEVPRTATAARSQMVAHAQSGAAPTVDVYSLDVTWTAEFASAGLIRPLDESRLDTSGFLDAPLESGRYQGKLWALPFNTDAGLLFYRKDLIGRAPRSLSELREAIEEYFQREPDEEADDPQRRTDPRVEAGYTGQFADYEGLTVNALEAIWAGGGDVIDEAGRIASAEHMGEGLRWLAEGLGETGDRIILPESRDFDEDQSRHAFQQGRVLFMRNWPIAYRLLTVAPEGEQPPMSATQVGVAPLPGSSVLGGQNLAVAANTEKPRAAQRLIEFLTSERSQHKLFANGGFAPTREAIYYDPDLRRQNDHLSRLFAALREARPRPITKHYEQFSGAFRHEVMEALASEGRLRDGAEDRLLDAFHGRRFQGDPPNP